MAPKTLVTITEITANANVKFKSGAGDLKIGTVCAPFLINKDPTPGKIPNKFETIIKIKMVATSGKYLSAFWAEPKVESINPKTTPCSFQQHLGVCRE